MHSHAVKQTVTSMHSFHDTHTQSHRNHARNLPPINAREVVVRDREAFGIGFECYPGLPQQLQRRIELAWEEAGRRGSWGDQREICEKGGRHVLSCSMLIARRLQRFPMPEHACVTWGRGEGG